MSDDSLLRHEGHPSNCEECASDTSSSIRERTRIIQWLRHSRDLAAGPQDVAERIADALECGKHTFFTSEGTPHETR